MKRAKKGIDERLGDFFFEVETPDGETLNLSAKDPEGMEEEVVETEDQEQRPFSGN